MGKRSLRITLVPCRSHDGQERLVRALRLIADEAFRARREDEARRNRLDAGARGRMDLSPSGDARGQGGER
jgi:hypothetical protein